MTPVTLESKRHLIHQTSNNTSTPLRECRRADWFSRSKGGGGGAPSRRAPGRTAGGSDVCWRRLRTEYAASARESCCYAQYRRHGRYKFRVGRK